MTVGEGWTLLATSWFHKRTCQLGQLSLPSLGGR